MKCCREPGFRTIAASLAAGLVALGIAFGLLERARAMELAEWVQNIEAKSALEGAFFRSFPLPSGPVLVRRPPGETRPALTQLIAAQPSNADLLALRAREDEQQLDFAAAEADWKQYAHTARDLVAGQVALADFYHRRLRSLDEVKALDVAAGSPSPSSDRFLALPEQSSWRLFERILSVVDEQALPGSLASAQYRAWMARYPRERQLYAQYFDFLLRQHDFAAAEQLLGAYEKGFPEDKVYPVQAQAELELRRRSADAALAVYDRSFQPLWPPELVKSYFDLLQKTHHLRDFLARARTAVAANPNDVQAASRLFYYYQQQGNLAEAQRALTEFRLRRELHTAPWTVEELSTLAQLFEGVNNASEAARYYYALYSLPGGDDRSAESALAGITRVLLTMPEQRVQFGGGDFSFYRDIASADPYPGFLNGILSLVLNSTYPSQQYANEEQASAAYFHRGRATELVSLFDSRFPQSRQRPELHAKLIEAYAAYGASDGVIRAAREFLTSFPRASQRTNVALLMADAYARKNDARDEFATYEALLKEVAAQADGMPLGSIEEGEVPSPPPPPPNPRPGYGAAIDTGLQGNPPANVPTEGLRGPRSPDYARVLDRYISRLVAMNRMPEVLTLYRHEIDRNPDDPGLYERLAAFMSQNYMGEQVEQVYRQAMLRFPDRSWYDKLARWYLRRQMMGQLDQLTREVVGAFSGTDLEEYFRQVIGQGSVEPRLYLQLNLYAHERFPNNLIFVRNLLAAYTTRQTANASAWERLLRGYWFYDDGLRSQFFEYLSRNGRLDSELHAIQDSLASSPAMNQPATRLTASNPAAAQFVAEAQVWRSQFEQAAPLLSAMAAEYPGNQELGQRAAGINRSLASLDTVGDRPAGSTPQTATPFETAIGIEENLHRYDPRDGAILTRIGEIYADRELFDRARPYWNLIPQIEPGKADGYLEAATVFWDYFRFEDALHLIDEGRRKLSDPALYAYQAGAIYENMRNLPHAIEEYVKGALAEKTDSSARARLLQLARRKSASSLVDEASARLVSVPNPSESAVALRVAILKAQDRRDALEQLLTTLLNSATTIDLLVQVGQIAQQEGFDAVYERSLERQIALTADPVEVIRLRLALARFYEGRQDIGSAQRTVEALYRDDSTILGVVRATVDFYWRNRMPDRAVDLLLRAAAASYPDLRKQFTFEAARKCIEAGQYARGRELLTGLLDGDPFNPEYLAAVADSYARAGDSRGLRDFYLGTIQALSRSPLPAAERTPRIAAMRRGLIPALTQLKDYAGAVDQYVEIINQYPEDTALPDEAAAYAGRYRLEKRLVDYYTKASAESPRDFRWPMVLARMETSVEDFPAAIADYNRAIAVRPDRSDLYIARAALEERLLRFDDAAQGYATIYELTYHNPQWMEKVAAIRARQGKTDAAVKALDRALVEGRPERPQTFFEMAARLEAWNFLPQARQYAERALDAAGDQLLLDPTGAGGSQVYARVMTRLREQEPAYARLQTTWHRAADNASKAGHQNLQQLAQTNFQAALKEMGTAVSLYFTPEEKASFQAFLESQKTTVKLDELAETLVPLAESSGLADAEARWRYELLMAHILQHAQMSRLITLQRGRMKFQELGQQLETYARIVPPERRANILAQAAQSYESAGDPDAELRVLSNFVEGAMTKGEIQDRFFALLRRRDAQRLTAIAESPGDDPFRDAVANFAVASGDEHLALSVISARGRSEPPAWNRAYTGLVGLYYADPSATVRTAFSEILATGQPIATRLSKPVDLKQQIAGQTWFYYGSRYGEYLDVTKQSGAEDYLPAQLEGTPGLAAAYFTLADYYRERGEAAPAIADYEHTLELDPLRGDAQDRVAAILWEEGKHDEATARWKAALQAFARQSDKGRLAEEFWENVRVTLAHIGDHRLLPETRDEADHLIRTYVHRNGSYRVEPLLEGAMAAAGDPAAGVAWLVDLAPSAPDPLGFLRTVLYAHWIPEPQREVIFRRILELSEQAVAQAHGEAQGYAQSNLDDGRLQWAEYLVETKRPELAQQALNLLSAEARKSRTPQVTLLQVAIAAETGRLGPLLDRYQAEAEHAPSFENLRDAANQLLKRGDGASARRVLEFAYTRELDRHNFTAANFLGLAEVQLQEGDTTKALALLRRLVLVAGEPFENLGPAADLLEKYGHRAESVEFLSQLVKATPWDATARLRLAEAEMTAVPDQSQAVNQLVILVRDGDAPYGSRASAAIALSQVTKEPPNAGSRELDLLSAGSTEPAAVEQPFFYYARLEAARRAADPTLAVRLLLGSLATDPTAKAPRLPLLFASAKLDRYPLVVAAYEPLVNDKPAYEFRGRSYDHRASPSQSQQDEEAAEYFRTDLGVTASEAAQAANVLADAYAKLDRLEPAQRYLRIAIHLETSAPARSDLDRRLDALKTELKIRAQNTRRRPTVTANLEQASLVQPRLAAPDSSQQGGRTR